MSNSTIIEDILREADGSLSGDMIWKKAKQENESIHRSTVSMILNKMLDRGKVEYDKEQLGIRRIKFWRWVE